MEETKIQEFLQHKKIAVVGVSEDRSKYGYKVYKDLQSKGYHVTPVNPNVETIEGTPCYPSLKELAGQVEGAVMVVPPAVTETSVQDAFSAGIRSIWMQPGAESARAVQECEENGMTCIAKKCIMVASQ